MSAAAVTREAVLAALEAVRDPHVPVSLRQMGMVADVEAGAAGHVQVRLRLPCMACPGTAMIRDGITDAISALPGVTRVEVIEAWEEPWHRSLADDGVHALMRRNGIQI